MSEPPSIEVKQPGKRAAFWITMARSVLATALGLALILQPEKTRPMLINFMGMFWLVAGLMSLRWGAAGERARRASMVAGGVSHRGRSVAAAIVDEHAVAHFRDRIGGGDPDVAR
jgi:uncharacterized membrane protein HdeD (DUF308 family)